MYTGFSWGNTVCEIVGCSFPSDVIAVSCKIDQVQNPSTRKFYELPSKSLLDNIYFTPNDDINIDEFFIFNEFYHDSDTPERIVARADERDAFVVFDLVHSCLKVNDYFADVRSLLELSIADGFVPYGHHLIAVHPAYSDAFRALGVKLHNISLSLYASTDAFLGLSTKKVPTTLNVLEWLVDRQLETELVRMCSRGEGLKAGVSWEYAMTPFRANVRLAQGFIDIVFDNAIKMPREYGSVVFPIWRESLLFSTHGERIFRRSRGNINWHTYLATTSIIDDDWSVSQAYNKSNGLDKVTLCYANDVILNNMNKIIEFINDDSKNSIARRIELRNLLLAINDGVLSPMCTSSDIFVRLYDVFPSSAHANDNLKRLLDDSGAKPIIDALMCGIPLNDLL